MKTEYHEIDLSPRLKVAQRIVSDAAAPALAAFRSRSQVAMRAKAPQDFVSSADEAVVSIEVKMQPP